MEMNKKIAKNGRDFSNMKQLSFNVITKKKVTIPKNERKNIEYDHDLLDLSENSLVS